jgi:ring-1,2-phenylacetyl-CoA epoxidase subunit PaaA
MAAVVPLCHEVGVKIPAHHDPETGQYELEYELPCQFDPKTKQWLFDETITWDEVWERWRARGPMNRTYVEMIQGRGDRTFRSLLGGNGDRGRTRAS